ncbi:hypothetical protein [Streptomyces abikoensis]|uniref:hypothetical protein n=1 Tax=Streptomyces abikoensis TaxID=97398 RepID=UPI0036A0ECA1
MQFRIVFGRLTRVITGTLGPRLARQPEDEWADLAVAQLAGVRATLDQLVRAWAARHACTLLPSSLPLRDHGRGVGADRAASAGGGMPDQDRRPAGEVASPRRR